MFGAFLVFSKFATSAGCFEKEQVREGKGNKQLWVWFRVSHLMYFSLLQITSLT
jgi:hypothetical protein